MNPDQSDALIRPATPDDVQEIHALVCELANVEKLRDTLVSTPADFHAALFGPHRAIEALVADLPPPGPTQPAAARLAGTALFFPTFSTFTGRPGLWLEDVYVRPAHRRHGIGRAFLHRFLAIARSRGCSRAEWSVLDWNASAIRLYENLGAEILPDWRICRVAL